MQKLSDYLRRFYIILYFYWVAGLEKDGGAEFFGARADAIVTGGRKLKLRIATSEADSEREGRQKTELDKRTDSLDSINRERSRKPSQTSENRTDFYHSIPYSIVFIFRWNLANQELNCEQEGKMEIAAVSRGLAPPSWAAAPSTERHGKHHHYLAHKLQLRNWCSTSMSLVMCNGSSRATASRSSSSHWGSTRNGRQVDGLPGPRSSNSSIGVAGVQAETSDEVTGTSRINVGQVAIQGLREEMEDDAVVLDGPLGFTYAAVFDGHVGFAAVQYLRDELYKECVNALQEGKLLESDDQNAVQDALAQAFHQTDTRLLSWLESSSEEKDAGATATILFIRDNSAVVAHVGDARAVLAQGGKAIDLSADHRPYGNSKKSISEVNRVKKEGGWITHGRLCSTLSVSRAFGDASFKTKKKEMIEDGITQRMWTRAFTENMNLEGNWLSVTPDVNQIKLEDPEFIIIASDGLWDSFKSNDAVQFIRKQLKKHGDVQKATEAIAQATLERHGQDNISIIILDFGKVLQEEPGVVLKFW